MTDGLGAAERRYLDALRQGIVAVLGDELLAIYLFGSGASGDYGAGVSDLDVQLVTQSPRSEPARMALAAAVSHRSLPCPARKLELVAYPRAAVVAPRMPVQWELNVNTGAASTEVISLDPTSEPAHWFLLDLAMGRSISRVLFGPPADSVIGPVPRIEQLQAIAMSLAWHAGTEPTSANAVLNACRAWRYIETATWGSKSAGAEWVTSGRREHAAAAAEALAARVVASRPLAPEPAARLVDAVVDACRRAIAAADPSA